MPNKRVRKILDQQQNYGKSNHLIQLKHILPNQIEIRKPYNIKYQINHTNEIKKTPKKHINRIKKKKKTENEYNSMIFEKL